MKKKTYTALLTTIFLALALTGCGKVKKDDPVLLTIGKTVVTESNLNERINNLPERYRNIVKKKKVEYIQEFINDTLLYQEAVRKGLDKVDDVKKVVEEAKKKILIARLLQDEVDKEIKITDEDINDFYEKNKKLYMTPEIMRVSHILVPTREEAEKIAAELANGADFEEMAKAKSVDPTAQRAGDIGYFPKGQLMTEFEDACAMLDKGQISGVVKTKLGYHIIKLTDRRAPELRKLDTVIEDIKARLHDIKRRELFNELLEKLKKETEIVVNEKALSSQDETGEPAGPAADTLNAQSIQNKEEK